MTVGEKLRTIRKGKGLSLQQVADAATLWVITPPSFCATRTASRIESGQIRQRAATVHELIRRVRETPKASITAP